MIVWRVNDAQRIIVRKCVPPVCTTVLRILYGLGLGALELSYGESCDALPLLVPVRLTKPISTAWKAHCKAKKKKRIKDRFLILEFYAKSHLGGFFMATEY